jgi:hypothetical protein
MRYFGLLAASLLSVSVHAADPVATPRVAQYGEDSVIAGKVKRECAVDEQIPEYVAEYGKSKRIDVQLVDSADQSTAGRVLLVRILDAQSDGNAFLGHHKSITVKGKLFQDGRVVGSFTARRNSMGGAFGGFKGSCTVLERTAKALGRDIAEWLVEPGEDSLLGELK